MHAKNATNIKTNTLKIHIMYTEKVERRRSVPTNNKKAMTKLEKNKTITSN